MRQSDFHQEARAGCDTTNLALWALCRAVLLKML